MQYSGRPELCFSRLIGPLHQADVESILGSLLQAETMGCLVACNKLSCSDNHFI